MNRFNKMYVSPFNEEIKIITAVHDIQESNRQMMIQYKFSCVADTLAIH